MFQEIQCITDILDEKLGKLNASQWNEEHKKIFVVNYLKEHQRINDSHIIWKVFQLFMIQ
jgi:hypothetical protein